MLASDGASRALGFALCRVVAAAAAGWNAAGAARTG